MTSDVLCGIDGQVLDGSDDIANITSWEVTKSAKIGEYVSSTTSGIVKRLVGAKDWEGSCDFTCDGELPTNMPAEGDACTLHLIAATGIGWTGAAFVETIKITSPVDETPISGSMTFKGNGALVEET